MKYILLISLFAAFGASAQTTYLGGVTTTVVNRGAFISDSMLAVPKRDTTTTNFTSQRNIGRIAVSSDSNIYYHNGRAWTKLSNQSPDLSGYVPYTGATANVDLGSRNLKTDRVNTDTLEPNTSAGLHLHNASHQDIFIAGAGGGQNLTIYAPTNFDLLKNQSTTDTVLTTNSSGTIQKVGIVGTYAPKTGGTGYIQNGTSQQTNADFNVQGTGTIGGTLDVDTIKNGSATTNRIVYRGRLSLIAAPVDTITYFTINPSAVTSISGTITAANVNNSVDVWGRVNGASIIRYFAASTSSGNGTINKYYRNRANNYGTNTALNSGNIIRQDIYYATDGTTTEGEVAAITVTTSENQTTTAHGGAINFAVTPKGSTTDATVMSISNGAVAIGLSEDGSGNKLQVYGGVGLYGSTIVSPSVNSVTANASAALEVSSTDKGFLLPRMTGAQAEAISAPVNGLVVYVNNGNGSTITSIGFWGYSGGSWTKLN